MRGRVIHTGNPAKFVLLLLCGIVAATACRNAVRGHWESVMTCILTLMLFLIPAFIGKQLHIRLPAAMEVTFLIFIFCAEVLGEIACFYVKYPLWDTMLHTVNGFLFAAFGFCLADLLNENPRLKFQLSPQFTALAAFCFSMTVGILWEFFEFSMDRLLALDMQKDTLITAFHSVALNESGENTPLPVEHITRTVIETADGKQIILNGYLDIGLTDTLKDLFVNFIGAAVFSVLGGIYVARRGKSGFAAAFIPVVEPVTAQSAKEYNSYEKNNKGKMEA
ncbi:MAG: hypothetical protein IKI58_02285 [Oscillospiraceae bacterium]|nr:hypothetical protein [Oscillospiraceae bacterium]